MKYLVMLLMFAGVVTAQESQPSLNLETAINVQTTDPVYAIELYNEVVEQSAVDRERNIAAFNRGVLLMESEDLDAAAEAFRLAGRYATNAQQRRDAMFNLGHALNGKIDTSGELMMDPEKIGEMIEALGGVERAFVDAARADRGHVASKKNVERIRRQILELQNMKDQIDEQQESEKQQEGKDGEKGQGGQGDQGQPGDMADELQDLADQQREQAQESESATQNQQQTEQQERSDEQEELSDQTEDSKDQMEEAGADKEAMEDLEKAMQAQQEAREALEKGDNKTAAQKQQEAADALERAADRVRESQQEQESEQQEGQSGQPQDQPGEEAEIDEVAQQLLNKERRERERRQAYRATGRPVKVEEDW